MGFSGGALNVIGEFAGNMRIHHIVPAADDSFTFEIESVGILCFTPSADGSRALISLKRMSTNPDTDDLKRFMTLSRWDAYF
ncbi:hypothetical protein PDO_4835 [Rhizobium sp. PDO1-076]|uniref:hypothetical protein n=1 Tax=Rhizobium sp. PDO1-076 TaxID=1125979 RepID=UPI00024E3242|nr:hypothetical protein [Rhizobium sp. PDO1-076]EHS52213.1 hypothetical protein PDO_4835 [Rhizobium sp. PDO1-076]